MKLLIRSTFSVVTVFALTAPALGDPIPPWANSYSANDACYCAPNIDAGLSKKIVPTPVGGKSISQICERVGAGPGLVLEAGEFNYPVYTDAQCGNGPELAGSAAAAQQCEGRLTDDDIICMGTGPSWDLKAAFAKKDNKSSLASSAGSAASAPVVTESSQASAETLPIRDQATGSASVTPSDDMPLATVVESKPLGTVATRPQNSRVNDPAAQLPAAEIVDSRVVSDAKSLPEATIVATEPVDSNSIDATSADAGTPLLNREQPQVDSPRPAVQTIIVRAPDTDSGAILVESEVLAPSASDETRQVPAQPTQPVEVVSTDSSDAESATELVAADSGNSEAATELVTDSTNNTAEPAGVSSALRIGIPDYSYGVRHNYVQIAPVEYDFGGSGGSFEGSTGGRTGWGLVGRASVVQEYSEYMLGARYAVAPSALGGVTFALTLGAETGTFDLGITDYTDTGGIATGALSYDFGRRLQMQSGVSYSSFFDGDPSYFGLLLLHLTRSIDIAGRFELGDNDNVGLGLRFHY